MTKTNKYNTLIRDNDSGLFWIDGLGSDSQWGRKENASSTMGPASAKAIIDCISRDGKLNLSLVVI